MTPGAEGETKAGPIAGHRSKLRESSSPTVVVDTSIAAKWFFPEPLTEKAESILVAVREGCLCMAAPDLIIYELADTLWKRCLRGEIKKKEALDILLDFEKLPLKLVPGEALGFDALILSLESGCTAYDAAFVAMARGLQTVVITADRKMAQAFEGHPLRKHIIHLREWPRGM